METAKLTNNEKSVLVAIVNNAKEVGDNGVEFILEDVAKAMNKNIRSISATAGSLAKKGMLLTANGESYFDGVVTEAGFHVAQEVNNVKQEATNNKTNNHMETVNNDVMFESPAMDERIVKLNELKSVKMAALSKSKRPAVKEAKGLAAYVLEKWDNQCELESLLENADEAAVTELGKSVLDIAQNRRNELNAIKIENARKEAEARLKEASTKSETDEADKVKTEKKKAAKTARKVGDLHPNGKWVWTEYQEGKFDWRTIPSLKQQEKRTDVTKKQATKKPASKAKKAEEPKKAEKPTYTIDEWVALPSKASNAKSKTSEAQKEAFKLINKGYRITADKKFYKSPNGETKTCNWASVEAMLKRYGIDYVPMGLILEEQK